MNHPARSIMHPASYLARARSSLQDNHPTLTKSELLTYSISRSLPSSCGLGLFYLQELGTLKNLCQTHHEHTTIIQALVMLNRHFSFLKVQSPKYGVVPTWSWLLRGLGCKGRHKRERCLAVLGSGMPLGFPSSVPRAGLPSPRR